MGTRNENPFLRELCSKRLPSAKRVLSARSPGCLLQEMGEGRGEALGLREKQSYHLGVPIRILVHFGIPSLWKVPIAVPEKHRRPTRS